MLIMKINSLNKDMKDLLAYKDRLQERLVKYRIYQNFLDKVVESSSEFHEIREVMGRFDTLMLTREVLF